MVPGRRFSTTTSAPRTRARKTALPAADLRSRASERLLRLRRTKLEDSPLSRKGAVCRTSSPPEAGFSTLTTSAPRSASCIVQKGPAMKLPTSTTRMPASGAAIKGRLAGHHAALLDGQEDRHLGAHREGRQGWRRDAQSRPPRQLDLIVARLAQVGG